MKIARGADPDTWRDRFRDPQAWEKRAELEEMARTAKPARRSVQLLAALGERLKGIGGDASGLLRRVQLVHPDDFWASAPLKDFQRELRFTVERVVEAAKAQL